MASSLVLLLVPHAVGCGKPPMQQVVGSVKIAGQPVEGCKVGLFPDTDRFDTNRHGFGFGITDASGRFEIQHPQGEAGIWAGRYKVTFVAWIDGKGKPVPADSKPSEVPGGVRNRFPEIYEAPSSTPETVTVARGRVNTFDFDIQSAGP
ncbi:MAG: hypothetical protein EBR86_12740 [Planctomycetia bacterium]|nr:hypothetical protein [Planctomycetia bacterium]